MSQNPEGFVELRPQLNAALADQLSTIRTRSFYSEQAERFELIGGYDLPLPNDPVFAEGHMAWCATAADMLLLRAYEQALGSNVTLLWDLAALEQERPDGYVVLSSRSLV